MTRNQLSNVLAAHGVLMASFSLALVLFLAGPSPIQPLIVAIASVSAGLSGAGLLAAWRLRAWRSGAPASLPA